MVKINVIPKLSLVLVLSYKTIVPDLCFSNEDNLACLDFNDLLYIFMDIINLPKDSESLKILSI